MSLLNNIRGCFDSSLVTLAPIRRCNWPGLSWKDATTTPKDLSLACATITINEPYLNSISSGHIFVTGAAKLKERLCLCTCAGAVIIFGWMASSRQVNGIVGNPADVCVLHIKLGRACRQYEQRSCLAWLVRFDAEFPSARGLLLIYSSRPQGCHTNPEPHPIHRKVLSEVRSATELNSPTGTSTKNIPKPLNPAGNKNGIFPLLCSSRPLNRQDLSRPISMADRLDQNLVRLVTE